MKRILNKHFYFSYHEQDFNYLVQMLKKYRVIIF